MWTKFIDNRSGGIVKESPYTCIYIEGSREDAIDIFMQKFHRNPLDQSCPCCMVDYTIDEYETFIGACSYDRGNMPLDVWINQPFVLIISPIEIDIQQELNRASPMERWRGWQEKECGNEI